MPNWSVDLRYIRRTLAAGLILLAVLYASLGCATTYNEERPGPQPPNRTGEFTATCSALYQEVLRRGPDPEGLISCVELARAGKTADDIRAIFKASEEYKALTAAPAPIPPTVDPTPAAMRGRLRFVSGQPVYPDGKPMTWRAAMGFALLDAYIKDEGRAVTALAQLNGLGVNVVRVLAANHGWSGPAPAAGLSALPGFLEVARKHDLYVQVVAVAGSDVLFNSALAIQQQVTAVGAICAAADNCVLEIANEPYHGSQRADLLYSPKKMAALRARVPAHVPTAYGAPIKDEPLCEQNCKDDKGKPIPPMTVKVEGFFDDGRFLSGGDFVVLHRKRRDFQQRYDNVRRIRELYGVADKTGKFVVDNEPTGAADTNQGSSRYNDPAYFFAQGVLGRLFGVGGNFHSSQGLLGQPLTGVQLEAAKAFVAGTRVVPDGVRLQYRNTGHEGQGSPASGADFTKLTRLYFGLGTPSIGVLVGYFGGDPGIEWANGYRERRVLAERPGVKVIEVGR